MPTSFFSEWNRGFFLGMVKARRGSIGVLASPWQQWQDNTRDSSGGRFAAIPWLSKGLAPMDPCFEISPLAEL